MVILNWYLTLMLSDYEGKTCEYLHMFNPKEMDPKCYMPGEGKKLWDRSIDLWKQIDSNYKVIGY